MFVLYNIPNRDCGQYSKGGAVGGDAYQRWITGVRKGIGNHRAVAVLEPDALGLLDKCLSLADQKARLELLRFAVHELESTPGGAVYLDAGHDAWLPPEDIAKRLKDAGIAEASGFALNTSNYRATDQLLVQPARPRPRHPADHQHRQPAGRRLLLGQAARRIRRRLQPRPARRRVLARVRPGPRQARAVVEGKLSSSRSRSNCRSN